MYSNIKVDFLKLISILHNVIARNEKLISEGNDQVVLQYLLDNYECKIDIVEYKLEYYKNVFSAFFKVRCQKLARLSSLNNDSFDRHAIELLEREGKVFSCGIFHVLKKHLFLEMRLHKKKSQMAINILTKLIYYLGNNYYYDADEETLEALFTNGLMLYLCDKNLHDFKDHETNSIIQSMRRLLCIEEYNYEIKNGEIQLSEDAEKSVQKRIETLIKEIGGIHFLNRLFTLEIQNKYCDMIDRFLISPRTHSLVVGAIELRIPYNLLIQIAVKHLNNHSSLLLTSQGIEGKYQEAINISKDYLNVLNLRPYSIYGDLLLDFKDIPFRLGQSILFEKMFTPLQYNPEFTMHFIKEIYSPLFIESINLGYTKKEYIGFCEFILGEKSFCHTYSFEDIRKATKIKKESLKHILDDSSFLYSEVNTNFTHILSETNYRFRPLVKLADDKYFLFSSYFNGFSLGDVLYEKMHPHYSGKFNRLKGQNVEKMVKSMFAKKGYVFHSGKYSVDSQTEYECDMVLETDQKIVFVEIKNQPLPDTFEQGDDVETLRALGEGMIKAQLQCYRHQYYLKNQGQIVLNNQGELPYILTYNNRKIICISVSSQEYLFLTNKMFSEKFLESLLVANYHAIDASKEYRLDKLNAFRSDFEKLIAGMDGKINGRQAFFNTLFRSAQQIYSILSVCNSLDEFIYHLTQPIHVADGSGDVYGQLLNSIRMSKS